MKNFGKEFKNKFTTDRKILFCIYCNKTIEAEKIFLVIQHRYNVQHQISINNNIQKQLITRSIHSEFNFDLWESLITAEIPLYYLNNLKFSSILLKYTKTNIPHYYHIHFRLKESVRKNLSGKK